MSDVFTIGQTEKTVELVVNGSSDTVSVEQGTTLIQFVTEHAQNAGIRTFSVYVDGQKIDTNQASMSLDRVNRVEIVAKDARG